MAKLQVEFPTQGWEQILTARKGMLDRYDKARQQSKSHEVETYHGGVAEAACRDWLAGFLPKRYGVTSGYIVSPGLDDTIRLPHFDVIIYDQLESPVLWIEDGIEGAANSVSRAIPVEHVKCVLEVKAAFTAKAVREAISHLRDLEPLLGGIDEPSERYKLHLPASFSCGLIFFELRKSEERSKAAISAVIDGHGVRGFLGGVILRGEGHDAPYTGWVELYRSDTPHSDYLDADAQRTLLQSGMSESRQQPDGSHIGASIIWQELSFAKFAFDLVAILQGTYQPGFVSSWYGFGARGWNKQ